MIVNFPKKNDFNSVLAKQINNCLDLFPNGFFSSRIRAFLSFDQYNWCKQKVSDDKEFGERKTKNPYLELIQAAVCKW